MAIVWSHDKIMHLIELFQSKSLLWDPSIKEYKDRNKKNDAIEEISSALNMPKKDVESKIHVLRTQFNREKKKRTTGSGAIEKCKWVYYEPLQFLLSGATTSVETDTMNKTEALAEINHEESSATFQSTFSEDELPTIGKKRNIKNRNTDAKEEEGHQIKKKATEEISERDEFTIYGQLIAHKIRKLNALNRLIAQQRINNVPTL